MRGTRTICLALLLAALVAVATAAAKAPPSLRLASMQPLSVKGRGFQPRERVRVTTVVGELRRVRVVRSTPAGAFVVTFASVPQFDPCTSSLKAYARGAGGDKASMTVGQRECPPNQ
jgi:hypothetical protein